MRPLLVVTCERLPEELHLALLGNRWEPWLAPDPQRAGQIVTQSIAAANGLSVGVLVIPPDPDPGWLGGCLRLITTTGTLRWVAVMQRPQTRLPSLQRLIAERLYDYQVAPVEPLRLCYAIGHAHGLAEVERELAGRSRPSSRFHGLIGSSPPMRALYRSIERVAATDAPVLITGPTGTGKELVARALHACSHRAQAPLVSLNTAALPPSLIQAELFGHARGAFTGAVAARPGLIEAADGGTLFLDEIGEMPLAAQPTLLRFLDDCRVCAVGATQARTVDVRIVAATNRDLADEVRQGRFRADLFYRLSVVTLKTPGLGARGSDIEPLARHFLAEASRRFAVTPIGFTDAALQALCQRTWPGHVRELRSCVVQAAVQCPRRYLEPSDLGPRTWASAAELVSLTTARQQAERMAVENALIHHTSNVTLAAKTLGISRMSLYRLMEKHQIAGVRPGAQPPSDRPDDSQDHGPDAHQGRKPNSRDAVFRAPTDRRRQPLDQAGPHRRAQPAGS